MSMLLDFGRKMKDLNFLSARSPKKPKKAATAISTPKSTPIQKQTELLNQLSKRVRSEKHNVRKSEPGINMHSSLLNPRSQLNENAGPVEEGVGDGDGYGDSIVHNHPTFSVFFNSIGSLSRTAIHWH